MPLKCIVQEKLMFTRYLTRFLSSKQLRNYPDMERQDPATKGTDTSPGGIGVSVELIREIFESPSVSKSGSKFTFKALPAYDGVERTEGRSSEGSMLILLEGAPENLRRCTAFSYLSKFPPEMEAEFFARNSTLMGLLLALSAK